MQMYCAGFVASLAFCGAAGAQMAVQSSHIEANVPSADVAETYLRRDLLAFFRGSGHPAADAVEFVPLRMGATQYGAAYPKFYFWVTVISDGRSIAAGAVRVAAFERKRFEVTHFVSRDEIDAHPERLASVFPAALIDSIVERAASR